MSLFVDPCLGSGVPVAGDPITSFENVPLLGLRTATIVHNSNPMVRDIVKVRFLAMNCGERNLEIVSPLQGGTERNRELSHVDWTTLLPGESLECSVFRTWDDPGQHQLTLAYDVRCAGQPFARLTYPTVAICVRQPEHSILWARAVQPQTR